MLKLLHRCLSLRCAFRLGLCTHVGCCKLSVLVHTQPCMKAGKTLLPACLHLQQQASDACAGMHKLTIGPKQSDSPPPGAPQAMLQLLFLLVHRLATVHSMDVKPKITKVEKECAPMCAREVRLAKNCLRKALLSVHCQYMKCQGDWAA